MDKAPKPREGVAGFANGCGQNDGCITHAKQYFFEHDDLPLKFGIRSVAATRLCRNRHLLINRTRFFVLDEPCTIQISGESCKKIY